MSLFKKRKEVWRDILGQITCPGDACPKVCDSRCPIWLNTMALMFMENNRAEEAIKMYEDAIYIAPDFYDAWIAMGVACDQLGKNQKAYECYKKAHQLNMAKPTPVYGLMISSLDLGKYTECLTWCNVYKQLSTDGRELVIQNQAKDKINRLVTFNDKQSEIVEYSSDNQYILLKSEDKYYFVKGTKDKNETICTPSGAALATQNYPIAERLLNDLEKYGKDSRSAESLLPWHYTLCDNFVKMKRKKIEGILYSSFLQKTDWTFTIGNKKDEEWLNIFGEYKKRSSVIYKWIKKCTYMQMTAACCIGNAYESINVAFILASIMENYTGDEREKRFIKLANMIASVNVFGEASDIMKTFENFDLYYGIHLDKNGNIIKKGAICMDGENVIASGKEEKITENKQEARQKEHDEADINKEDLYGKAWLLIIGKTQKAEGLEIMRNLDAKGYVEATLVLGMFAENSQDRMRYITKAAKAENPAGLWQYASFMNHSFVPDKKDQNDMKWVETVLKAAELGSVDAMNEMGNICNRWNNYAESMYWYAMANAHGKENGEISLDGIAKKWKMAGCPREFEKGTETFNEARFDCAIGYLEINAGLELSVSMDDIIAINMLGIPIAAYLAGDIFEAEGDMEMAYRTYSTISFENDPHGIRCYADMLYTGRGVEKNEQEAIRFYKMAAELGEREAMYITGIFTETSNINMAAYWYGMSHVRGYGAALDRLISLSSKTK